MDGCLLDTHSRLQKRNCLNLHEKERQFQSKFKGLKINYSKTQIILLNYVFKYKYTTINKYFYSQI